MKSPPPAAAPKPSRSSSSSSSSLSSSSSSSAGRTTTPPSYTTTSDCSQGICSSYCLQWCSTDYFFQPPPDSSSSSSVSPLLVALICILSAAFLLLVYYTCSSRFCKRRRPRRSPNDVVDEEQQLQARIDQLVLQERLGPSIQIEATSAVNSNTNGGLDDGFIKSITVFKYKRGDGLVESTDCAVCLTEFKDEESLRLMPNCQHAFHPPCIDTWLRSQASCPICRSPMIGPPPQPATPVVVSRMRVQRGGDVVVVIDAGELVNFRGGEIVSDRRRPVSPATGTDDEVVVGDKEKGRAGGAMT